MACWAVIPVKASGEGKSRLAGVLGTDEREALVDAMLGHVIGAVQACPQISRVHLVGPSRRGMDPALPLLDDPGHGLNAAASAALAQLAQGDAERIIVIHGDLPRLTPDEVSQLCDLPPDTIGLAPDRHGIGTNAISLPTALATDFGFMFGQDSFARHRTEAARLGYNVRTIIGTGLQNDVDEPADLTDAEGIQKGAH